MSIHTEKSVSDISHAAVPMTDDERIDLAAAQILQTYKKAFEELAK